MPSRLALVRCAAAQVSFLALGAAVRRFRRGLGATRAQLQPYAEAWEAANDADADGRLWVVLGDSTAQGIGAASPEGGYVGQVRALLAGDDGRRWRVANLSRSGARADDVLAVQLPRLRALPGEPDLVTCAIGANDLLRTPLPQLLAAFRTLIAELPRGTVLATLPQGLASRRARRVNALIRAEAPAAGLVVADVWARTGAPWTGKYAADMFHPNERGYADWAAAFADALDLPPAALRPARAG